MILLYILLSVWPSDWYQHYSVMNWDGMCTFSPDIDAPSASLAAQSISLFGSGEGDSFTYAARAIEIDTTDFHGWTALAYISFLDDSVYVDSLFNRAFLLEREIDPVLNEAYAYWLLSHGDFPGAIKYSELAVEADSSFGPAWLTLSMTYSDMQMYEKAVEISEQSILYVPDCIPLLNQYATVQSFAGHSEEAIEAYEELIDTGEARISAYRDLAYLYKELKKDGQALKIYRKVIGIDPSAYPWAWDGLGQCFLNINKYSLADSAFQQSLNIFPDNVTALYNLAKLRAENQPVDAINMLEQCVLLDSTDIAAWQDLAFLYENVENFAAAGYALEKCIDIAPEAWLFGELGWVFENRGLHDEAAAVYEESLEFDSMYVYGWQRRGQLFVESDSLEQAADWFNNALDVLEIEDSWILQELGSLAVEAQNFSIAEEYLHRALQEEHEYALPWLLLARVQYIEGKYTQAESSIYEYMVLSEDSIISYAEIILITEKLGCSTDSLESFALNNWPDLWLNNGWSAEEYYFDSLAIVCANKAFSCGLETPWQYISLAELFGELDLESYRSDCYEIAESMETDDYGVAIQIADYYYRQERYQTAIDLLLEAYDKYPWNEELTTALAEAYLFYDASSEAQELLLQVVGNNPSSTYAIAYLGLVEENKGNVEVALDYYLEALRIEPGYQYAEARIRFITSDSYNPNSAKANSSLLHWNGWINLSSTGGNIDEQKYGGGGSISLNYSSQGSVSLELSASSEIQDEKEIRKTGWASFATEQFLTNNLYIGGSSSWDRQPLTVRPWQVSSYLAAGWKSWPTSWFWIAPETGAGLVNTRWSTDQDRVHDFTAFASLSTWARSSVSWLPTLWLSGSVYVPPDDLTKLVSNGVGELEFNLTNTISLVGGISFDYTRTPVVSSWEKLDSEVYIRLKF